MTITSWKQDDDILENFLIKTDSYKVTHFPQYPKGTTEVYSYGEARGCTPLKPNGKPLYDYSLVFGLQYVLKRHLAGPQVTHEKIDEAKLFFQKHFGADLFNEAGWRYIADHYNGYLPLIIKALPEGIKVPLKTPLFTIVNTDPECFWLTNYVETIISHVWHPLTVATNSAHARDIIRAAQDRSDDSTFVDYSLHDFGGRGGSTYETSGVGGMAHLVSFNGTDTMWAISLANKAYNQEKTVDFNPGIHVTDIEMFGNSVVATEHSTMTSWGREHERDCILNLLRSYPTGLLSVVGDSFNIYKFAELLYTDQEIKEIILKRDGKFVLRPDSGDPIEIICGQAVKRKIKDLTRYFEGTTPLISPEIFEDDLLDEVRTDTPHGVHGTTEYTSIYKVGDKYYEATIDNISWNRYDKQYYYIDMFEKAHITVKQLDNELQMKGLMQMLWEGFDGTTNAKGYKVLNPKVGLIQGDGIDLQMIADILTNLDGIKFAASNIVFGSGGGLIQKFDRDTLKFAIKCTHVTVNGKPVDVQKDPITASGKKSKKGYLAVHLDEFGQYVTKQECTVAEEKEGLLRVVFFEGDVVNTQAFNDVRKNARK